MLNVIKEQADLLKIEVEIEEGNYEFTVTGSPWHIAELYKALQKQGLKVVSSRNYLGTIFVRK